MESLRAAIIPPKTAGLARRVAAVLCLLAALVVMLMPVMQARTIPNEQLVRLHTAAPILPIAMGSTFGFMLLLAVICLAGPSLLGTVTNGWTKLVALRQPSWLVARRQANARMRSLSSTVIPLIVGVSLLMMTDSFYQTSADSSRLLPPNLDVSSSDFFMLITLLGPALVVTLAGVCAGYLISAHGRSLDCPSSRLLARTRTNLKSCPLSKGSSWRLPPYPYPSPPVFCPSWPMLPDFTRSLAQPALAYHGLTGRWSICF